MSGWRCLDAFAGSGALGFEAASRGAAQAVLLERDRKLAASLEQTRERLRAACLHVHNTEALAWMARCAPESFELVFIDPPFDSTLLVPAIAAAARLVVPDGFVYIEAGEALAPDAQALAGMVLHKQGRAGVVHFHLAQKSAQEIPQEIPQEMPQEMPQ